LTVLVTATRRKDRKPSCPSMVAIAWCPSEDISALSILGGHHSHEQNDKSKASSTKQNKAGVLLLPCIAPASIISKRSRTLAVWSENKWEGMVSLQVLWRSTIRQCHKLTGRRRLLSEATDDQLMRRCKLSHKKLQTTAFLALWFSIHYGHFYKAGEIQCLGHWF
jgi:hypothetical protein